MDQALLDKLCELVTTDETVRAELAATGELFDGYHPRMAEVHAANAATLARIVDNCGWPGRSLVGEEGADAAWLVLQHSIGHPALQRQCLPLLQAAAAAGDVPLHQPAYLEDRICAFEGRPQRYGTQLDWDENGELNPLPLQDPEHVDSLRESVGLGPLAERVEQARVEALSEAQTPPEDFQKRHRERIAWARSVGWL